MNKFIEVYLELITEEKFSDKKWKFDRVYEMIEIYENFDHLKERLNERYKIEIKTWFIWNTVKASILDYLINNSYFDKCNKKQPYQRMMVCYLTISNMWIAFIIQNDLDDKKKRIYFSTFLPDAPKIHPYVELIKIEL